MIFLFIFLRLTKTFLTLSLEDVASKVGLASPKEAERQLVTMIEEGSIFARISQKDGNILTKMNSLYQIPSKILHGTKVIIFGGKNRKIFGQIRIQTHDFQIRI